MITLKLLNLSRDFYDKDEKQKQVTRCYEIKMKQGTLIPSVC